MHVSFFKLAPAAKRDGVSCDAGGAFIGYAPLLKRANVDSVEKWIPRNTNAISKDLSRCLGLPIDASSKAAGIGAIATALNAGDIVRAQMLTLFLRFPDPTSITKPNPSRTDVFKFVDDLINGNFIKIDQYHWPAGALDDQGGQFAPKGEGILSSGASDVGSAANESGGPVSGDGIKAGRFDPAVYHPGEDQIGVEQVADKPKPKSPKQQEPHAKAEQQFDILDSILAAVFGTPQNTTHKLNDPHEFASRVLGKHLEGKSDVKEVWYHSTLRKISKGAIDSDKLADVTTVGEDGTMTPYEIPSPKQTVKEMEEKYDGIEAKAGSRFRLAQVKVLTMEEAWGLPEAAEVAEAITKGEAVGMAVAAEEADEEINEAGDGP